MGLALGIGLRIDNLPAMVGGGAPAPTVTAATATANGANIDVTLISTVNLLISNGGTPGVVGILYSIGAGVPPTFWQDVVADEALNHVFSIPFATIGAVPGDTVNVQPGFSTANPAGDLVLWGSVISVVAPAIAPAFPAISFTDTFAGTNGNTLPVYNAARYAAFPVGGNNMTIGGAGTYATTSGSTNATHRILDAPIASHFDITLTMPVSTALSSGKRGGVFFNATDTTLTANGYALVFTSSADKRLELWKIVGGAFDTLLDSSTVISFTTDTRIGVRWFGDGAWQLYYSPTRVAAWNPTGTPGSDLTYPAAGSMFIFSTKGAVASATPLDDLTLGTW